MTRVPSVHSDSPLLTLCPIQVPLCEDIAEIKGWRHHITNRLHFPVDHHPSPPFPCHFPSCPSLQPPPSHSTLLQFNYPSLYIDTSMASITEGLTIDPSSGNGLGDWLRSASKRETPLLVASKTDRASAIVRSLFTNRSNPWSRFGRPRLIRGSRRTPPVRSHPSADAGSTHTSRCVLSYCRTLFRACEA